jgi:Subtilase family
VAEGVLKKYNATLAHALEGTSGTDHVDLAKYYTVLDARQDINAIIDDLHAHDAVQVAYIEPESTGPAPMQQINSTMRLTTTAGKLDFRDRQSYLLPGSSGGVGAIWAWIQPGGQGGRFTLVIYRSSTKRDVDGINVFDVEQGWNQQHEDLLVHFPGRFGTSKKNEQVFHGTAVAGIIGGDVNDFGVQGIAPNANFYAVPTWMDYTDKFSIPKAIMRAADASQKGDIILIEQHTKWNVSSSEDTWLAVEWWPLCFDAIKYAVSKGRVVIEAAGNGGIHLMDSALQSSRLKEPIRWYDQEQIGPNSWKPLGTPNPFDPNNENSGAVLVGAGAGGLPGQQLAGPDRSRIIFSNYGARVDVQAQGENVASTTVDDKVCPGEPNSVSVSYLQFRKHTYSYAVLYLWI